MNSTMYGNSMSEMKLKFSLKKIEDREGQLVLSKKESWFWWRCGERMVNAQKDGNAKGKQSEESKGGFVVDLSGLSAFLGYR